MKATLKFTLPEEAVAHQDAVDGGRWRGVVRELGNHLRARTKHQAPGAGNDPATVDALWEWLHTELSGANLSLEDA
jgi:hypothetical protein